MMNQDVLWKNILDELFPDFLAFFFPEIYRDIDISAGYQFLDKELTKIIKDSSLGSRIVDKLVKVYLQDGSEKWLLIHLEIQGYPEENFPERMFIYNYRIFDRYHKEVISLAVLTDTDEKYRPAEYRVSRWRFNLIFQFPVIKLIDYRKKWNALRKSKSPFAYVVMAYLKTQETEGDDRERYGWKKRFLKELYLQGMNRETISALYNFIDWMMNLPEELEDKIYQEIVKTEEEHQMAVLSTAERIGRQKGIREGRQEGRQEGLQEGLREGLQQGLHKAIADILEIKFGEAGVELAKKIVSITSIELLENLRLSLKKALSVTEAGNLISNALNEN